jgi:hypothetical protein
MKNQTPFVRVLSLLPTFFLIAVITYGFLSLCNWNFSLNEWTGFSRFVFGIEGLAFLIKIWDVV